MCDDVDFVVTGSYREVLSSPGGVEYVGYCVMCDDVEFPFSTRERQVERMNETFG